MTTFLVKPRVRLGGFVVAVVLSATWPVHALRSTSPQAALTIVVIAGEDAVNLIQQKTAVAPIVEVRDRNDQPVAGAVVNFAIRSQPTQYQGTWTFGW